MNIAGMVLGIVAVTLAWIPIIGTVSIPLVSVGLPLSFFGLRQNMKKGTGIGMAVTGLVTNLVALAFIILYVYAFFFGTTVTTESTPTP